MQDLYPGAKKKDSKVNFIKVTSESKGETFLVTGSFIVTERDGNTFIASSVVNSFQIKESLKDIEAQLTGSIEIDHALPLYKNGTLAKVGDDVVIGNDIKEIIRVDSRTRQVWYKTGGFDWFEDMKNYVEV